MDLKKLFMICLSQPSKLPIEMEGLKIELKTVIEGAIFIAISSALFDALIKLFFIPGTEISETIKISGFLLTINPLSMFVIQFIIIIGIMLTILFFGNFSDQKVSLEELGKNVLIICLVSLILNFILASFLLVSNLLFFYMNLLKSIWFVWALSSVVAILYKYKSVILTALLGTVTAFFIMGFLFMLFVSLAQLISGGNPSNV